MKRPAEAGFSLLELAVAVIIIALLGGALLQRLNLYQQRAEQAGVEQTLAILRVALAQKSTELKLQHRDAALRALEGQNPMAWLSEQPANYRGEFYSPSADMVGAGNWYFDRQKKALVYLHDYQESGSVSTVLYQVKLLSWQASKSENSATSVVPVQGPESFNVVLVQVDG